MRFHFKDKELKELLKNLTVIIDTREQNNKHITDFFDKKKIPYKVSKLDFGDYACMIPEGSFEGQTRAIYFDRDLVIERKNSIDELAGNLKDDTRILKELAHMNKYGIKYYIFVEEPPISDLFKLRYLIPEKLEGMTDKELMGVKEDIEQLEQKGIHVRLQGFDFNVRNHIYKSNYQPKSLYARLKTIEARYKTIIRPVGADAIGSEIYNTLYYYVREQLKNVGYMEGEE